MALSKPPDPPPYHPPPLAPPPPPPPPTLPAIPVHPTKLEHYTSTYPPKEQDSLKNSIYFENFPEFQNESEFKSLLRGLHPFTEIRIIQKRNKAGKKFGFLKCDQATNIDSAIKILNGIWIGKLKINANKAKFNMISKREANQKVLPTKTTSNRISSSREVRTYAEVMKGKKESTNLEKISMIYDTKSETPNWLERSCLGVLRSLELIPHIHQIVSSHYPGSEVRVLGGNLIITTFPHSALKEKSFNEENVQWTANFFDLWRDWEKHDVAQGRFAWLKITRVPLHVWKTDFFKALVCGYGDFILESKETESKSRLDIAKILINTSKSERIHELIKVQIDGENYHISIIEDGIQELLFPFGCDSPSDGEFIADFIESSLPIRSPNMTAPKYQFRSPSKSESTLPTFISGRPNQHLQFRPPLSGHSQAEVAPQSSKIQTQIWRPVAGHKSASTAQNQVAALSPSIDQNLNANPAPFVSSVTAPLIVQAFGSGSVASGVLTKRDMSPETLPWHPIAINIQNIEGISPSVVANSLPASPERSPTVADVSSPIVPLAGNNQIEADLQTEFFAGSCDSDAAPLPSAKIARSSVPLDNSRLNAAKSSDSCPPTTVVIVDSHSPAKHAFNFGTNQEKAAAENFEFFISSIVNNGDKLKGDVSHGDWIGEIHALENQKQASIFSASLLTNQNSKSPREIENNQDEKYRSAPTCEHIDISQLNVEDPICINPIASIEKSIDSDLENADFISPLNVETVNVVSVETSKSHRSLKMDLREARRKARKNSIFIPKKSRKVKKLSYSGSLLSTNPDSPTHLDVEYVSDSDINAGNGRISFPPKDLESDSRSEAEEILQLGLQIGLELNRAWDEAMDVTQNLVLENNQQTIT